MTRADIAALVGVRLESLLARARPRQVIITDIRGHWAQPWIAPVVRAGVMDTLANYEFEPKRQVRRGELATTVSRLLSLIAAAKPELAKKWPGARVAVNDVGVHASELSGGVGGGGLRRHAAFERQLRAVARRQRRRGDRHHQPP